jgi:PIN domain nuclease of toxin-antitoxin system
MRLLLDTHVLLWTLEGHARLAPFRAAVTDPGNAVFFSAVSVAEIAIKSSLGKLEVAPGYVEALVGAGYRELALTAEHAQGLAGSAWRHRDPFDRMLIAQAMAEGLTVATVDPEFAAHGVQVLGGGGV